MIVDANIIKTVYKRQQFRSSLPDRHNLFNGSSIGSIFTKTPEDGSRQAYDLSSSLVFLTLFFLYTPPLIPQKHLEQNTGNSAIEILRNFRVFRINVEKDSDPRVKPAAGRQARG